MSDPLISIIISTKDKPWHILERTLCSILSSSFKDYEVVVVDQNTDGDIKEQLKSNGRYLNILHLEDRKTGLSTGRNIGISHSCGKWLIFFDDDAILNADSLEKASPFLYDNVRNPMIYYGNVLTLETNTPYLRKSAAAGNKIGILNFDAVSSIALLFNRRVFSETGIFDVDFGAGAEFGAGEESDVILRALRNKFDIIYLEKFTVYHPSAQGMDLKKRRSYGKGVGALYKKHIFVSFSFFIFLFIKICIELILRSILILSNIGSYKARQLHIVYLQGFIEGFIYYKRSG